MIGKRYSLFYIISDELCKTMCGDAFGVICKRNSNDVTAIECACLNREAKFLSEEKVCKSKEKIKQINFITVTFNLYIIDDLT